MSVNQKQADAQDSTHRRQRRTLANLGALGRAYRILAILLIGLSGGAVAPWFVAWWRAADVSTVDPIAIANTFIVFTTIIFVGITVIIAVVSYVVTAQLAATSEMQERQLLEKLKGRLVTDEKLGTSLATAILDNPDVQRFLEKRLEMKLNELVNARLTESRTQTDAFQDLARQLQNDGDQP